MEVELELRSLRLLRDEVENLRGTLENVRTRLNALEQGGRSGTGSTTHTLGWNRHRLIFSDLETSQVTHQ